MGAALAATPEYTGLWTTTHTSGQILAECNGFSGLDVNGFCWANDNGGAPVALGTKFTTSEPVLIRGVRIYRVDGGSVSGSLWNTALGGTLLATGTFAAQAAHGWQDLIFTVPVPMLPGDTYVASYWVQDAYAYEYTYFAASPLTVGPISAVQSVTNGTYCFSAANCYPASSIGANWVTPLWVTPYGFTGFYEPVDNTNLNVAKAGSAIPVKFSLDGDQGLDIFLLGYPLATEINCDPSDTVDVIEQTVTAGGSSLTYDALTGQYTYVWKTQKAWAGKCFHFALGLDDLSPYGFDVQFKK